MRGHREDFQPVRFGKRHSFLSVGSGAGVGIALAQVEFPAGFFPAIEAGRLQKLDPLRKGHIAELPADQANLVERALAVPVCRRLLETHQKTSQR